MANFFSKQFIDVLEWTETEDGVLSYKYPMQDNEIQTGAKLTVRESQMAMFVNKGTVADVFQPGLYTLNTDNLPLLTDLMNWDKMFQSPFRSDVYFFSTREQINQQWGTQAPITIRDKSYGVIRLRAFGTYSYKIADPRLFYQKISGTRDVYKAQEMDEQLRAIILTSMGAMFGNANVDFIDMAANQLVFSEQLQKELKKPFADYGLELAKFFVQSITLPEELQEHLDKVTSMRMVGDLKQYTQFQAAEALEDAARNEGGTAGIGAGIGAGLTMAQAFSGAMQQSTQPAAAAQTQGGEDPFETINKLHDLLGKGILSQEEFDAKKAEILKKI